MILNPEGQTLTENYKLLTGAIVPRPIAFVSTVSANGVLNLAPFSFFTGITSQPPTVCFAPGRYADTGGKKDTLQNIEATKEFVVNIVTESIAHEMNVTATEFPEEVDEFEVTGLTPAESRVVKPPRVLESPINFECKLEQIVQVGPEGPGGGALVIGRVVLFHVQDDLIDARKRIDHARLQPVGRLAGMSYTKLGEQFALVRPKYQKASN